MKIKEETGSKDFFKVTETKWINKDRGMGVVEGVTRDILNNRGQMRRKTKEHEMR